MCLLFNSDAATCQMLQYGTWNIVASGVDSMMGEEMLASNGNADQPHVELVP